MLGRLLQRDDEGGNSDEDADEEDASRMQFVGSSRPSKPRAAGPQEGTDRQVRSRVQELTFVGFWMVVEDVRTDMV